MNNFLHLLLLQLHGNIVLYRDRLIDLLLLQQLLRILILSEHILLYTKT